MHRRVLVRALQLAPPPSSASASAALAPHARVFALQTRFLAQRRDRQTPNQQQQQPHTHRPAAPATRPAAPATGDWKASLAAFERQLSADTTPDAVLEVVALCAENGRHREAQEVVRRAQQLGVAVPLRAHALLCSVVANKRGGDRALDMLDALQRERGATVGVEVYDPLLSVLKAQGDWRAAHRAIQQMHALELQPPLRAFRVLLLAAAKARQKDTVLATAAFVESQFGDVRRDVVTLTAICQALVAVGEARRVLEIHGASDRAWLQAHGNTLLFNNFLLAALQHDRVLDRAMAILAQMQQSARGRPDAFAYTTCMVALEKRGEWDRALALFNDMQEVDARRAADAAPVVSALTCAVVIRALHHGSAGDGGGDDANDTADDAEEEESPRRRGPSTRSRTVKRDLNIVLKKLAHVDVSHLGHASTLVDTLDEFRLYTAAREVFARMMRERVVDEAAWLRQDGYEVDLHTFSLGVAKCATVHAFEAFKRRHEHHVRTRNDQAQDLRIVTGVGRHSKEFMRPRIRDEVLRMFAQSFRPPLWPATHPTNPGVIVVRSKTLRSWVRKDGVVRYF